MTRLKLIISGISSSKTYDFFLFFFCECMRVSMLDCKCVRAPQHMICAQWNVQYHLIVCTLMHQMVNNINEAQHTQRHVYRWNWWTPTIRPHNIVSSLTVATQSRVIKICWLLHSVSSQYHMHRVFLRSEINRNEMLHRNGECRNVYKKYTWL